MANRILTGVGWQGRVRDKLGVDAAYLPDSALEQPDCIDVAEQNIISETPGYATLSDEKTIYLEAATVCECALIVVATMRARLPERTRGPHAEYDVKASWDKRREELMRERTGYLSRILTYPSVRHFGKA
jgi:hypothetical protein